MSDDRQEYEFIGGSLDGQRMLIGGTLYPGMNWSGGTIPGRKREIYILHEDGRFHFERLGLDFNPRADAPEVLEELTPIMQRLGEVLNDLDAVLDKYGGPSAHDYSIGNWKIRHKDA